MSMEASPRQKQEVIIRGKSITTFPDLATAGRYYLEEYYSQWLERRIICIVPPIPWTAYNRVLGPQLKPEESMAKIKGDDAELIVYKSFLSWGEKNKEPMFLVAQVDYDPDNKIKNTGSVLSSFLTDEKGKQLAVASKKMDIDLLVLHAEIGAIIVEIKAASNPLTSIRDALISLNKGEDLLRLFCEETFPIYKIALFPNCAPESLTEARKTEITKLRAKNIFHFCDESLITKPDKLFDDLKAATRTQSYRVLPEVDKLLCWVISLKCLVSSTSKDQKVAKVTLTDDIVSLHKQVKMTDCRIVQHDVYSKADQKTARVKKVKISTQLLYLNPEQIAVWDGPEQQLIHGIAGTGKTVLIQHKVLDLDKKLDPKEQIIVMATEAVSSPYRTFFEQNQASNRVQMYNMANAMIRMKQLLTAPAAHLFVDEAQNLIGLIKELIDLIKRYRGSNKYLWIALDPVQAQEKMIKTTQQLKEELQLICLPPLSYVMRCTPEVTHFWSKHLPDHCPAHYSQGNRLYVQDVPVHYANNDDQAVVILQQLLSEHVDGEHITYKDCAVLIHSPMMSVIPIRRALLAKFGWSEDEYFRKAIEDIITIRDIPNDIWSLEWAYVFLVAKDAYLFPTEKELDARLNKEGYWNSAIYLASSRCKVQLFLISMERGERLNVDMEAIYVPPERITYSFTKK